MRKPTREPRSYSRGFGIPMPDEDQLCELCESVPGKPQVCTSDGARHGHGMIHATSHNHALLWVCDSCHAIEEGQYPRKVRA